LLETWQRIIETQSESGRQKRRDYDWSRIQQDTQAAMSSNGNDPTVAARRLAGLLHHMMQQVRQQQQAAASDSNVDLV
jgi:hypothetical protein